MKSWGWLYCFHTGKQGNVFPFFVKRANVFEVHSELAATLYFRMRLAGTDKFDSGVVISCPGRKCIEKLCEVRSLTKRDTVCVIVSGVSFRAFGCIGYISCVSMFSVPVLENFRELPFCSNILLVVDQKNAAISIGFFTAAAISRKVHSQPCQRLTYADFVDAAKIESVRYAIFIRVTIETDKPINSFTLIKAGIWF